MIEAVVKNKVVIILLGPPGSGKGTQGELLADKLGLYYFEMSKILEHAFKQHNADDFVEVRGKKYYFGQEKKLWETGILCSPPLVAYLVKQKIEELFKEGKNIVMAGPLRTIEEAEDVIPFLKKLYKKENIKVILIEISPEQTIYRNTHRRICELMRHPILYSEETKNLAQCPLDGSKLVKREKLDDPETIKVRIKEYQERTLPLIEFFAKQGLKVNRISGEQSVAEVFGDILKKLE